MIPRVRLTTREADREASIMLDDAIRCVGATNQGVADACHVTEKRVREWRDPDSPRNMPASKILLLPRSVRVAFRLRQQAWEVAHDDGPAAQSAEKQLVVTSGTAAALAHEGLTALITPGIDAAERRRLLALLVASARDNERLQAALRELDRHDAPAAGGH